MLTGMDCCDPNGLNRIFNGRLVRQELQAYQRRGLSRRQRSIIALLGLLTPGATVLDIGCGIGAVGTTLLRAGAGRGTFVDISAAYLRAARQVAAHAGFEATSAFYQDDFAVSERRYAPADVVVLDRVVCCYPDATALLTKAARCSRGTLIFTSPKPFWFMPLLQKLCAFGMRLFGQEYRFFLHDRERLLQAATSAGHVPVVTRSVGLWQVTKLTKVSSS